MRWLVLSSGAALALLGVVIRGQLLIAWRAERAEVAAFASPPPLVLWVLLGSAAVGLYGWLVLAAALRQPRGRAAYRIFPLFAFLVLVYRAFLVPRAEHTPFSHPDVSSLRSMAKLARFMEEGHRKSGKLPPDSAVRSFAARLGRPGYRYRGRTRGSYRLVIERRPGPRLRVRPGDLAGTIYLRLDRRRRGRFRITGVGLCYRPFGRACLVRQFAGMVMVVAGPGEGPTTKGGGKGG